MYGAGKMSPYPAMSLAPVSAGSPCGVHREAIHRSRHNLRRAQGLDLLSGPHSTVRTRKVYLCGGTDSKLVGRGELLRVGIGRLRQRILGKRCVTRGEVISGSRVGIQGTRDGPMGTQNLRGWNPSNSQLSSSGGRHPRSDGSQIPLYVERYASPKSGPIQRWTLGETVQLFSANPIIQRGANYLSGKLPGESQLSDGITYVEELSF